TILWVADCIFMPLPPSGGDGSLWHSRQSVNTTGRRSSLAFVDPCGWWHVSQPSTLTTRCSKTQGPRLSVWHFRHGLSLPSACCPTYGRLPIRQVGANVPCGL